MTRWFLVFFVGGVLTILLRVRHIADLLAQPSAGDVALVAGAALVPLAALLGWQWSRTSPGTLTGPGLPARLARDRSFLAGSGMVVALCLAAVFASVLSSHDPLAQPDLIAGTNLGPSFAHPFGTDAYSRDVLARLLHGARWSLSVALGAVVLLVTIGTLVGVLAGLSRGALDLVLMRLVDAGLAIPRILLLLVVATLWRDFNLVALAMILGLTGWFGLSRIVRAEVLSLRERPFVAAAMAMGMGRVRLIARHILPNLAGPVTVSAALGVGNVVLIEASLSYLGIGARAPDPAWGSIIRESHELLAASPWTTIFPGLAIFVTVAGFSLMGDGLRAALNPQAQ